MFTLRQAVDAFARLDGIPADDPGFDKAVRNLSQRTYLPASGREGRADLYSLPTVAALRISQKAALLISDRWIADRFARWMQSEATGPAMREEVPGGMRNLSPVEEAVARVNAGEDFNFIMAMRGPSLSFFADWHRPSPIAADVWNAVSGDDDVRLVVPASRLIAALFAELSAGA